GTSTRLTEISQPSLAAAEKILPVNQHATEMPLDGNEQRPAKEVSAEPLAAYAALFFPLGKERRADGPRGRYRANPAVKEENLRGSRSESITGVNPAERRGDHSTRCSKQYAIANFWCRASTTT